MTGVGLPLRPFLVETSMLEVLEFDPTEEVDEVDPCKKVQKIQLEILERTRLNMLFSPTLPAMNI